MADRGRALTSSEREALLRILEAASFKGAAELRTQAGEAIVVGGPPTLLRLSVQGSSPVATLPDGPIPVEAHVHASDGIFEGEILVWVKNGYLSALEFAWVRNEDPTGIPAADRIRIRPTR